MSRIVQFQHVPASGERPGPRFAWQRPARPWKMNRRPRPGGPVMRSQRPNDMMTLGAFFHPPGKFDLLFVAYALPTRDGDLGPLSRWPQYMVYFDPVPLMSALAALTRHIG